MPSVRSGAGDYGGDRLQHDEDIVGKGHGLDVLQVQLDPALEGDVASAADLPETGEAGLDGQAAPRARVVLFYFRGHGRARADDRHVAAQDVEKLRHLVNAELADESADPGDARIA